MVAQYGRDARRHLPSRSVCRRQIDVPTTFLEAREPHVTAKWRHRIRARVCLAPKGHMRACRPRTRPLTWPMARARRHSRTNARGRRRRATTALRISSGRWAAEQTTRHQVGAGDRTQSGPKALPANTQFFFASFAPASPPRGTGSPIGNSRRR
jgi:hypothetical protein